MNLADYCGYSRCENESKSIPEENSIFVVYNNLEQTQR